MCSFRRKAETERSEFPLTPARYGIRTETTMIFLAAFLMVAVWATLQFGKLVTTNSILEFLVFIVVYVLMHALYFLVFWLLSLPCDKTKPIEKQRHFSRTCVQSTCSFLCSYLGVRVTCRAPWS